MYEDFGDFQVYYEVSGNENGPWLALIHGLAGSTRCWRCQLGEFNKHFKVLNVDFVGHGQSSCSSRGRYSGELLANHLRMLMDRLGISKVHVLGLSLGTAVQQYFCEMFPERTASTIYASPTTKFSKLASFFFNGFSDKVLLKIFPKSIYMKFMGKLLLPGKTQEKSRKLFIQEALKMPDKEFSKWWRVGMQGNHYDFIGKSRIPALMIAGEKDFIFKSDSVALMEKYADSELAVIKGAGHVTVYQKPEEFNRLVVEFIKGVEARKDIQRVTA